jgi:hypothetical protein
MHNPKNIDLLVATYSLYLLKASITTHSLVDSCDYLCIQLTYLNCVCVFTNTSSYKHVLYKYSNVLRNEVLITGTCEGN